MNSLDAMFFTLLGLIVLFFIYQMIKTLFISVKFLFRDIKKDPVFEKIEPVLRHVSSNHVNGIYWVYNFKMSSFYYLHEDYKGKLDYLEMSSSRKLALKNRTTLTELCPAMRIMFDLHYKDQ